MKLKSIAAIIVLLLVVASLLVAGCTSATGPALTLSAASYKSNSSVLYGRTYEVNATITNNHAGTIKLSSNDFQMQDTNGRIFNPVTREMTVVSENGDVFWMVVTFQSSGAAPSKLTYYDGTNKADYTF